MANVTKTPTKNETPEIERFLAVRGWKRSVNYLGEIEYTSPNGEWQVQINPRDGWSALCKFTDADVADERYKGGLVAEARFITEAEYGNLKDLHDEMVSVGAMEWECPYCGETGGQPYTASWREFQGCREHGGMVEFEEERCTKCVSRRAA